MTQETDNSEPKKVRVQFLETDLSGGRKVHVGYSMDDPADRSFWFKFEDGKGGTQDLRLSEEAFSAIISLRDHVLVYRDTATVYRTTFQIEVQRDAPAQ